MNGDGTEAGSRSLSVCTGAILCLLSWPSRWILDTKRAGLCRRTNERTVYVSPLLRCGVPAQLRAHR